MTVTSLLFFTFAALAALVFHKLPERLRPPWLLLISAAFLASWSWQFVLVLAVYSVVNFMLGRRADPARTRHKMWAQIGIVINVLFLLIFKYGDFYLPQFSGFLSSIGMLEPGCVLQILLPVGLSFLVVQNISYLLDIANQRLAPEASFIRFCVYIFYFPKLLSGPVERARVLLPRLDNPLKVDRALLERSTSLILSGLIRKLVIANPLFNMIPAGAFSTPLDYPGQLLLTWILAYAFALYNDFAGYTAIVRGVSLWFGIELSPNFNLPYYARNFTEFWNRWHISLSSWLRDYIFYPLAWSLRRRIPDSNHVLNVVLPPIVTMLVSGMWHGLSWNLLLWGGLHGVFMILERLPSLKKPAVPLNKRPRWRQRLGVLLTFSLATLAWVPFRMEVPVALQYWNGLLRWTVPDFEALHFAIIRWIPLWSWSPLGLPNPLLILVLAAAITLDAFQNHAGSEEWLLHWPRWAQILVVVVLLLAALLAFFADTSTPFVYQGF
jgi:D-alanyl-lipoteichoic acid acyltransferase DltB (MBOAT superfamily)